METRRYNIPRIVLRNAEDDDASLILLEGEDGSPLSRSPHLKIPREQVFVLQTNSPRDVSRLRMCNKEEQRLRNALARRNIVMEELVVDDFEHETTQFTLSNDTIDEILVENAVYVSLMVQPEGTDTDAQWSDIVIKGSAYGVRYSSKECDTVKIRYAWGTHFLFRHGLFVEMLTTTQRVGEKLLRRTLTILRDFCGFPSVENWHRQCYSSIVSGRIARSIDLSRLAQQCAHSHPYMDSDDDTPPATVFIRYDQLRPLHHHLSPNTVYVTGHPLHEALRCGSLVHSVEEFELFLTKVPLVLFLVQADGTVSCDGVQSREHARHCFEVLLAFLSLADVGDVIVK